MVKAMDEIEVVLFDIGWVLAPSVERPVYENYIIDETDVSPDEAWKLRDTYWKDLARGHIDEHTYWNHVIDGLDLPYTPDELKDAAQDQLYLVDGAADVVEKVSETYPIGVISNHYTPWADTMLRDGGIQDVFNDELVFISDQEGLRKPDQRLYQRAIDAADVPAEHILFFDDSEANVNGARRAGMNAVQVDSPDQLYETVQDTGILQ